MTGYACSCGKPLKAKRVPIWGLNVILACECGFQCTHEWAAANLQKFEKLGAQFEMFDVQLKLFNALKER